MNTKDSIRNAYDHAAEQYAADLWNELDGKPFDRKMLGWFAERVPTGETILEIGSGPGEVSAYLTSLGAKCLVTDISPEMIAVGKRCCPEMDFEVQDFFQLKYERSSFSAVLAFYAIVNLTLQEARMAFAEVMRVLKPGGIFFLSFHIKEEGESLDVENFFSEDDNPLTFYYFTVEDIKQHLEDTGFEPIETIVRYPYEGAEYPSKRAYIMVRKTSG